MFCALKAELWKFVLDKKSARFGRGAVNILALFGMAKRWSRFSEIEE